MKNNLLPILLSEQIADSSVRVVGTSVATYYKGYDLDDDRLHAEQKLHQQVRVAGGEFVVNPQMHVICGENGAKGLAMSCLIGVAVDEHIESRSEE